MSKYYMDNPAFVFPDPDEIGVTGATGATGTTVGTSNGDDDDMIKKQDSSFEPMIMSEDIISAIDITTEKMLFRNWINTSNISGKILEIEEKVVIVECLLDKEPKVYQKRAINRNLFVNIDPLEVGRLVWIRVFESPPESKIRIEDGENIVPPSDFSTEGIFDKIVKSKIFTPPPNM